MTARRVAILVENAKDSGGSRVIFNLVKERVLAGEQVTLLVVLRNIKGLRDLVGQVRDLIACKLRVGFGVAVRLQIQRVRSKKFREIVSTSRRTLDFITSYGDQRHIHLFQHIEAWRTLNSDEFRDFCQLNHYPSGPETVDLIKDIGIPEDVRYLEVLGRIKRIQTVSCFLKSVVDYLGAASEITVSEPPPHIKGASDFCVRDTDVLLFVRGLVFKGDQLSLKLACKLGKRGFKIMVVAGPRTHNLICKLPQVENIKVLLNPIDDELAKAFARSRIVVHPSLCEGFGSIPQESMQFGCATVASGVGWLHGKSSTENLHIMRAHDIDIYEKKIVQILG